MTYAATAFLNSIRNNPIPEPPPEARPEGPGSIFTNSYRLEASADDARAWLCDTPLLQSEHPRVRILALRLTQRHREPLGKALACFDYVRALPFSLMPDGHAVDSVEVVRAGYGDSRTKSTLLIGLLRAMGIPARIRALALPPYLLHGFFSKGVPRFNHVITEVLLNGFWLGVDTYGMDPRLLLAVRTRLEVEQLRMGYGVHSQGSVGWDGTRSAFGVFRGDDPMSAPQTDWGTFNDYGEFAVTPAGKGDESGWTVHGLRHLAIALANKRIRAMRQSRSVPY